MKVEGETAYEPDLLVLMERIQEMDGGNISKVYRQSVVIKDRSTVLDGKVFQNPGYEQFAPAIEVMLESPVELETAAERDSGLLFRTEEDKFKWKQERKIKLEEIENYLVQVRPGLDAQSKKFKIDAVEYAFETRSWTAVEQMHPDALEQGFFRLQEFVKREIERERTTLTAASEPEKTKTKIPAEANRRGPKK